MIPLFLALLTGMKVHAEPQGFQTRADAPPRKVVIASAVARLEGTVDERLDRVTALVAEAQATVDREYPGRGLDLMVFPEFALCREQGTTAAERSVEIDGRIAEVIGGAARKAHAWLVVPMTLQEPSCISNAAVLFNREGAVAGVYRKVHPMTDPDGQFEGGVRPGTEYPVFQCDFGKLGILICWDMGYEAGWDALAAAGAELVALPSASPQTIRPSAEALRHHYYVVNSAPRDNASLFDPIGRIVAQKTTAPGVLVHQIDLAYAILHWNETLQGGRALSERYGSRVGFDYSEREDTGIFWSNDPSLTIGRMIREFGFREMPQEIERIEVACRGTR